MHTRLLLQWWNFSNSYRIMYCRLILHNCLAYCYLKRCLTWLLLNHRFIYANQMPSWNLQQLSFSTSLHTL